MRHELYESVEEMLAPETLSALAGQRITMVHCTPWTSDVAHSGSHFLAVETNGGLGPRYILKRLPAEDWIVRATGDHLGREIAVWQAGLLDRLLPEVMHPIVACASKSPGRAILMRDISAALIPLTDDPISEADHECILGGLAALHSAFWVNSGATDPALGLCDLWHRYTWLSPEACRREASGSEELPRFILEAWDVLDAFLEADVARVVCQLLEDPQPLCSALSRYPHTLVHGDVWTANLGVLRPTQVVLVDWAIVGCAPPAVDLAYYLASIMGPRLPVPKEKAIASYRRELSRRLETHFDDGWWQPQLDLALLGGFLQLGWIALHTAARGATESLRALGRADVVWWSKQVRAGADRL